MYNPGKCKEYVREHVIDYLSKSKHVITMPNIYFHIERSLIKKGIKITCFEINERVYKVQILFNVKGVKLNNKSIFNESPLKYDGMFLDFCGLYNNKIQSYLLNVKPKTKVVITLLMARESKTLQRIININDRESSYLRLFQYLGYNVEKYINYNDSSPMATFFMQKL